MNKKILSKFEENYRAGGLSVLLTDIIRESTKRFNMLTAIDGGELKHYVAGDLSRSIFKNAVRMCREDKFFKRFVGSLPALAKSASCLSESIIGKDRIAAKDWRTALGLFDRVIRYYARIDFDFYSEDALSRESAAARKNFGKLLSFKNEARKKLVNRVLMGRGCYFNRLTAKIARQCGLHSGDIDFYTGGEVFKLLKGKKVSWQTIRARKDIFIIYSYDSKVRRIWGKEAGNMIGFLEKKRNAGGSMVRGLPAYRGKGEVSGRARIIKLDFGKIKNLAVMAKKFRQGEVLVADATTPEMLPIMKKAAAIITDFGGLNTHAAIISRELKIPCIVGTKIATQILRDGDFVEVDAENGIVKIIIK